MFEHDRILALDIGASSLKMAEFLPLKSGGIELVRYGISSLGLEPQAESERTNYIITTIEELMREHQFRPGPVLVSVSGQAVFSRFVKLPPVDKDKVFQIVQYEAQQNVPFPINEVVWDYQLIGSGEGELDVMLAAIKANLIHELTEAVEQASLFPDLVDVAPVALYNAVRYNYPELQECTLVIDMGARSTDLIFIEGNRMFMRSIPVAGNAITQQIMREFEISFSDAEDMKKAQAFVAWGGAYESPGETAEKVSKGVRSVMTRLHAEVNRSINFYRGQQDGSQPKRILLTGGSSVIPYTDQFFKDKLQAEVDYLNPFMNVAVEDSISSEDIGRSAHMLGEVVGLALRRVLTCPIEVNLMPPKGAKEKELRRKQPMILAAAFGLVVVLGVWCAFFFQLTRLGEDQLEALSGRVEEYAEVESRMLPIERELRRIEERIEDLYELAGTRTRWMEMLDEIHQLMPGGMWLTDVRVVREDRAPEPEAPTRRRAPARDEPAPVVTRDLKRIEISGLGYLDKVESAVPIRTFRDALRASPYFKDGTEITHLPAPNPNAFVREFRIMLELEDPIRL